MRFGRRKGINHIRVRFAPKKPRAQRPGLFSFWRTRRLCTASSRLRLVQTDDVDPLEDYLASALAMAMRGRGFTETHAMVTRQLERLAKANRAALASEGWIA